MQKFLLILISIQYFFFSSVVVAANNEQERNEPPCISEQPTIESENLVNLQLRYQHSMHPPCPTLRACPDLDPNLYPCLYVLYFLTVPSTVALGAKVGFEGAALAPYFAITTAPFSLTLLGCCCAAGYKTIKDCMDDINKKASVEGPKAFMLDFLLAVATTPSEWEKLDAERKTHLTMIFTQAYENFKQKKEEYEKTSQITPREITEQQFAHLVYQTESTSLRKEEAIEDFEVRVDTYLANYFNLALPRARESALTDARREDFRCSVQ